MSQNHRSGTAARAEYNVTMSANNIDSITFSTTGLRQGYDSEAVDDLLDRISDALDGNGTMRGEDVRREHAELPTVRHGGYDIAQVDETLERIANDLDSGRMLGLDLQRVLLLLQVADSEHVSDYARNTARARLRMISDEQWGTLLR
ncbi:DivIVA domain-containing protein [Bifidobacterium avesanii]|nr:DivIVA domain-containing protein [Bifidobacterium avesanii]